MRLTKNIIFLYIFSFYSSECITQNTFQRTFGHERGSQANTVFKDSAGDYIIAGWYDVESLFSAEFYLAKLDSNADTIWTRSYGSAIDTTANFALKVNGSGNEGYHAIQTADNGYAFVGERHDGSQNPSDVYLVKTDNDGMLEWARVYGSFDNEYGLSVQQTDDGGYAIGGFTESYGAGGRDMYLMKVAPLGGIEWTRTYGSSTIDAANQMRQTDDGGFILVGYTFGFGEGSSDMYVVKTNSEGNIEWENTYGGQLNDIGHAVTLTADGGYLIAGESESFGTLGTDVYLLKLNASGGLEWSRTYGGEEQDAAKSVQQTNDDGYIIAGHTRSFGQGNEDFYMIKIDDQGNHIWSKTFGGPEDDAARSIEQTDNSGFIMTGYTRSFGEDNLDVYLIKTDSLGNSGCDQSAPATQEGNPATVVNQSNSILGDGGQLKAAPNLTGFTNTKSSNPCDIISSVSEHSDILNTSSFVIFPNPVNQLLTISYNNEDYGMIENVLVYDMLGQVIFSHIWNGVATQTIDISDCKAGAYFIKIISTSKEYSHKIIKY